MAYTAEVSRVHPGCVLFLLDESYSMSDRMGSGSKADAVAAILNRTLQDLIVRCAKEDGIRDYFDVGVLGYHSERVRNGLDGALDSKTFHPISHFESHPLRLEERMRKMDDGAGGLVEHPVKFPVWYEPHTEGGTPMRAALTKVAEDLAVWCDAHPASFPPVVLHLTDGESTDGNPEPVAEAIRQLQTDDGNVVLMNIHISPVSDRRIEFPDRDDDLPNRAAKLLFGMSSMLPAGMVAVARDMNYPVTDASRAFMFNAQSTDIVQFFEIGTRATSLR